MPRSADSSKSGCFFTDSVNKRSVSSFIIWHLMTSKGCHEVLDSEILDPSPKQILFFKHGYVYRLCPDLSVPTTLHVHNSSVKKVSFWWLWSPCVARNIHAVSVVAIHHSVNVAIPKWYNTNVIWRVIDWKENGQLNNERTWRKLWEEKEEFTNHQCIFLSML